DCFTVTASPCTLDPVTFTAPADLCVNAGVQAGLGSGSPTGGVYSGTGVIDDGNGMTYSFDPGSAGVGVHAITYTGSGTGCTATDMVEVFDLPVVSLSTALYYCVDAPLQGVPITGGSPSGGVYSGPGVTDNGNGINYSLDPTVGGPGTITITYTITDANGCSNSATSNIEIIECEVEITDPCMCLDNATV
ncbi:MAG: Ig-like domain-containing protein, partial [Lewinella sp.]|uniref:Ig-like domain-containing protein n=1 Tax=Lewinella sp. TaxID=2004506 RepID=UPI003D6C1B24